MKRLYNEYSAAPCEGSVSLIDTIMAEAFQKVWDTVVLADDVCPRDAESLCHSSLSCLFSEHILRQALQRHRQMKRCDE